MTTVLQDLCFCYLINYGIVYQSHINVCCKFSFFSLHGGVTAQWIGLCLGIMLDVQGVTGSSPVSSTTKTAVS